MSLLMSVIIEGINATGPCEKEAKLALFLAVFIYVLPKQTKRRSGQLVKRIFEMLLNGKRKWGLGNISCRECVDSEDQILLQNNAFGRNGSSGSAKVFEERTLY